MSELDDPAIQAAIAEGAKWPDRPVVCTFAARLPFPLGLSDGGTHKLDLIGDYMSDESEATFPGPPYVQVRICNLPTGGLQLEPATSEQAIRSLYGTELGGLAGQVGESYDQWVSLETPSPRLSIDSPKDAAYPFHRCLRVLDLFLRSHNLAFRDPHVHPLASQELSPVVFVGEYEPDRSKWTYKFPVLIHPGRLPQFSQRKSQFGTEQNALAWGFRQLLTANPFVASILLGVRADRAVLRGDYTDHFISMQTAVESRLYAIWALLLVDGDERSEVIKKRLSGDTSFRSLVATILPKLLGGSWDVTKTGTPAGEYWQKLYLLRNRVVHVGYEPSANEAEAARTAYDHLRAFLRERLWARRHIYPRAAFALIGGERTREDPSFERKVEVFKAERAPFFLPWDEARRVSSGDDRQRIGE